MSAPCSMSSSSASHWPSRPFPKVFVGVVMAAGTLFVLDASMPGGFVEGEGNLRYGQTMAFTTLMFFQMFNVVNARSDERSAFVHLFTNRWLWGAVAGSVAPAGAGGIRAVSPARLWHRRIDRSGLDVLYCRRQFRVVAEGRHETDRASERLTALPTCLRFIRAQRIRLPLFGILTFERRVVVWIRIRRRRITRGERSLDRLIEGRFPDLSFFVRCVLMFRVVGQHCAPPDKSR